MQEVKWGRCHVCGNFDSRKEFMGNRGLKRKYFNE